MKPGEQRRRGLASLTVATLVVGLLGGMAGTVLAPSSASAVSSQPEVTIRQDNTFNAYVAAGENLDILFTKTRAPSDGNSDTTITVRGPGGIVQSCLIPASDPAGVECGFSDLTSTVAGVWEIEFDAATQTTSYFSWAIDVQSGTTTIPGRVWTSDYTLYNTDPIDLAVTYVSEQGFQYAAIHSGYRGVDSNLASDAVGNTLEGTCIPAYKSYDGGTPPTFPHGDDAQYASPIIDGTGGCGEPYKIFFETPAPDLPETAAWPDGSTSWVIPPVTLPDVTNLVFDQNSYTDRSGTFTVEVANFSGPMSIQIDANNDGDYSDPEDVSLPLVVVDGTATVTWDGLDGLGNPAATDTELSARAYVDRTGEIHFVSGDMEGRTGLHVTALNGPQAGSDLLYWDDTDLREADRLCTTPDLDGTAGVSSAGGVVHGWPCFANVNDGVTGSWGDVRMIDDWTYTAVEEELAIPLPVLAPNVVDSKSVDPASGTTVLPGQELTYTLTFENTGDAPGAVDRVDDLTHILDDAAVTVAPVSSDPTALAVSAIADGRFSITGELQPAQVVTVTYTVTVNAAADLGDTELANFLLDPTDPTPPTPDECAPGDEDCTYNPVPRLEDSKSVDPASGTTVEPGQELTYTLTFENTGSAPVDVDRVDDLTHVLDDATVTATPVPSDAALAVSAIADGRFSITGELQPAQVVTVTYTVTVNAAADLGDTELANFLLDPTDPTPPTPDECAPGDEDCTYNPIPNIVDSKSVDPASGTTVLPGQELTYTLTFENTGDAPGAVDRVDDLTHILDDAAVTVAPVSSDPTALAVSAIADGRFSITGELQPAQVVTVTYTVTVNAAADLGDTELANFLLDPTDPTPPTPDECAPGDEDCTYNPVPNITVVKTADPEKGSVVNAGQEVTYTLAFSNNGQAPGTIDYTDHMAGVLDDADLVDAPAPSDNVLTVSDVTDGSFTIIGELAPGQRVTVTYAVQVRAWTEQGDHNLGNVVAITGQEPPVECAPSSSLCTEHPTVPPTPIDPPAPADPTPADPAAPTDPTPADSAAPPADEPHDPPLAATGGDMAAVALIGALGLLILLGGGALLRSRRQPANAGDHDTP